VSTLHYLNGSKRNWDLCLGGVCLNFTKIKGFRLPISCWASFSWVWDRRTNYLQEHKPDPKRLKGKIIKKRKKPKKTGPPAEANDPVL